MTPSERATIAALTRWTRESATEQAAKGQAGLQRKFVDQVDPNRELPEAERNRRARTAQKLHMTRLAIASHQKRRARAATA